MAPKRCCCGGPKDDKKSRKFGTIRRGTSKKGHGKKRTPNMFIIFYMEMYRKHGGNMYCVAQECGRRWRAMSQEQKDHYKKIYCSKCQQCKSCGGSTSSKGGGGKTGGNGGGKTGGGKGKRC